MINRFYILIWLTAVVLVLACSALIKTPREIQYRREVVFETKPGKAPYYIQPALQHNISIDFEPVDDLNSIKGAYGSMRSTNPRAPSIGFFWALNDDKLAFINRRKGEIYILDLKSATYSNFKPEVGDYDQLRFFWAGPEDDIYALLNPFGESPPYDSIDLYRYENIRLFRFEVIDGRYCFDDQSNFPSYDLYPYLIRVSPLNNIFVAGWGSSGRSSGGVTKFNKYGRELKCKNANGETLDGSEFSLQSLADSRGSVIRVRNLDNNEYLYVEEMPPAIYNANFKYTFDNCLLISCQYAASIELCKDTVLNVNRALILGKNFSNDKRILLDLGNLRRRGYKYYNISDISLTYKNEIYAIIVYYNKPGEITGDEKIVLYRWRQKNP